MIYYIEIYNPKTGRRISEGSINDVNNYINDLAFKRYIDKKDYHKSDGNLFWHINGSITEDTYKLLNDIMSIIKFELPLGDDDNSKALKNIRKLLMICASSPEYKWDIY